MVEKRKLQKRVFIGEDDVSSLLQRYTAMTVLTVLQEVSQVQDVKIDWNELVKKTTTGITNAREYQMLWRHLAYHHGLLDKFDDDSAQPLDDDSDLEYELEAFPPVSSEASAEATAYVKVLIASGVPCDSHMSNGNTIEAPLTISIPNGQTSGTATENSLHGISAYGTKITVPVSVEKQPLTSVTAAEVVDTNGPANSNFPPRRRRKPWSAAEDMELIAAVQKCGEGNWANILKGDFKGDRTASQLSQRWAIIRKRHGNMVGNGSQLSEAQLAARHAMSLALGDNLRAACPISTNVGPNSGSAPSNSLHFAAANNASGGPKSEHQQDLVPSKPRVIPKNPLPKPAINPDSMVKTAAMAAGSRIATPSGAAASLQKAAESKKVVQIMPGGTPAVKSSVPGSTNGLPSNVHFIRTGLVSRPPGCGPSNASQSAVRPNPMAVPSRTNVSSGVPAGPTSSSARVLEAKTKAVATQEIPAAILSNARREKVEIDQAASMENAQQQVRKGQTFGSGNLLTEKVEGQTSILGHTVKEQGGESKASRVLVQEKLIPSVETVSNNSIRNQGENSNKNENTKIVLALESSGV
ncbi:uncharacterized protein LOC107777378 isoform X2 [Nicotiana tabacum]|uniref:Uncharacterized protein LOC107777378 isoform X2 n=1 Tax=Nicotiana tabacum TaxID=4097 RepID=A0A1S3YKW5_TOBAC|nr:PREDICTED: uncharacterized protein LOC107777378 [Nicotiana tabacum]